MSNFSSLIVILEVYSNGSKSEVLDFISFAAILCGILVITVKNPVVSVLFLIGLFVSISGYLILLGISFIGISYLLVYVGAVSILFLFILMLINIRISEILTDTSNSLPLAFIIGIYFYYYIYKVLPYNMTAFNNYYKEVKIFINQILNTNNIAYTREFLKNSVNNEEIAYATSNTWDGSIAESSHITSIGNVIYTNYSIWLIITSIILLLAMVGVIVITIKHEQ